MLCLMPFALSFFGFFILLVWAVVIFNRIFEELHDIRQDIHSLTELRDIKNDIHSFVEYLWKYHKGG